MSIKPDFSSKENLNRKIWRAMFDILSDLKDEAYLNVLRAGHAQLACEVSGAIRPPAAVTHRSELSVIA